MVMFWRPAVANSGINGRSNTMQDPVLIQANEIWKFLKDDNGKEYCITFLSHWSEIQPVGGGEAYMVKWLGGPGKLGGAAYVSTDGIGFSKIRKDGPPGE
jgi:hypothetical protein